MSTPYRGAGTFNRVLALFLDNVNGESGELSGQIDVLQRAICMIGSGFRHEGIALCLQLCLGSIHILGGHGNVAVGAAALGLFMHSKYFPAKTEELPIFTGRLNIRENSFAVSSAFSGLPLLRPT